MKILRFLGAFYLCLFLVAVAFGPLVLFPLARASGLIDMRAAPPWWVWFYILVGWPLSLFLVVLPLSRRFDRLTR